MPFSAHARSRSDTVPARSVSRSARSLASRWFHGTLLKAGTRRTNVVNLATALHRDALAMELGQELADVRRTLSERVLPAVINEFGGSSTEALLRLTGFRRS